MTAYELVTYQPEDLSDDGFVSLRDPYVGQLHGRKVLIGDEVDDTGRPVAGEHSSQRLVWVDGLIERTPLRLDPVKGLVMTAKATQ